MPELINQRTMQRPGEGIVNPAPPTMQHQEYPKHMRHPGFAPAMIAKEVHILDDSGRPTGRSYFTESRPQRYPPVLVRGSADEEYHKSQGYETVGTCSGADFARLVQANAPAVENHTPIEYPKWVQGKLVNSAEEEAKLTGVPLAGTSEATSADEAPAVDTEVNTLAVIEPVETKEARKARLLRELAELDDEPIVTLNPSAEPLAMKEPVTVGQCAHFPEPCRSVSSCMHTGKCIRQAELAAAIVGEVATEIATEAPPSDDAAAKQKARSDAIKAGLARKKAKAALPESE